MPILSISLGKTEWTPPPKTSVHLAINSQTNWREMPELHWASSTLIRIINYQVIKFVNTPVNYKFQLPVHYSLRIVNWRWPKEPHLPSSDLVWIRTIRPNIHHIWAIFDHRTTSGPFRTTWANNGPVWSIWVQLVYFGPFDSLGSSEILWIPY